jgi:hypothetical protein
MIVDYYPESETESDEENPAAQSEDNPDDPALQSQPSI